MSVNLEDQEVFIFGFFRKGKPLYPIGLPVKTTYGAAEIICATFTELSGKKWSYVPAKNMKGVNPCAALSAPLVLKV